MAVEVVGGEVEEDGALGREVARVLELEAGALADDGRLGIDLADQLGERRADVAGDRDRLAGAAVEVAEQLDRGRLAVGPGHREEAVGQRPPGQLQLPDDLDPPLQRRRDHRRLPGHTRALDDRPRPLEQRKSIRIQERLRRRPPEALPPPRDARNRPPAPSSPRPASRRAAACPDRASPTTRNGPRGSGGRICFGGGTLIQATFALGRSDLCAASVGEVADLARQRHRLVEGDQRVAVGQLDQARVGKASASSRPSALGIIFPSLSQTTRTGRSKERSFAVAARMSLLAVHRVAGVLAQVAADLRPLQRLQPAAHQLVGDAALAHLAVDERQPAQPAAQQGRGASPQAAGQLAGEPGGVAGQPRRVVAGGLAGDQDQPADPLGVAVGDHRLRAAPVVEAED